MAQLDAKKFAESHHKKDTLQKKQGSQEEKQKPQAEQKEDKKAAAPAPEEEMDGCKKVLAVEPKSKDPFAHLPKKYHFPEELTQTFMSYSVITGMFQQLDKLRKNAFTNVSSLEPRIAVPFLGLDLLTLGAYLYAESKSAGGLQIIHMVETGSHSKETQTLV
ncbi:hypothetical protein P7K49_025577 [Saguinus oedipus]|uniref:EF-1-gamma C-terminal domain-containing protein n=1 Tax=Saguinus oedipus TaxID=9490 RepID=A0ABQ9UHK0_SAGOE|nr:hypothetical protein P7K49_025577 [Saguinus oedipus]